MVLLGDAQRVTNENQLGLPRQNVNHGGSLPSCSEPAESLELLPVDSVVPLRLSVGLPEATVGMFPV